MWRRVPSRMPSRCSGDGVGLERRGWGYVSGGGARPSPRAGPHPRPLPPLTRLSSSLSSPSVTEEAADRHPERRMRAAFTAFEEAQLPRLKQENPNMRLSQLKQLLKKEWLRSPDNPMNQRAVPFNTPK